MVRCLAVFGLAAVALSWAALASSCEEEPATAREAVTSDAARASADDAAIAGAAAALDAFGANLYSVLARDEGNLVLSPYSAMVALGMTRHGAAGDTRSEMDAVLHAAAAADLDAGLNAIDQALATRPGEYRWGDRTVALELSTANRLFAQQDFPFHDTFLDTLAADYGAGVRLVDYRQATEEARTIINQWVNDQTHDRIPELITPGVLDDLTRLVLTNAIYLNAPWMYRFDASETAPGDFHRLDGSSVQAEMMHLSLKLPYSEGQDFQAVQLPYVDRSLAMLVIVPEEDSFHDFEASLDAEMLTAIVDRLDTATVTLALPKFEFRTQASLKDALSELGMPTAFDERAADFTAMSPAGQDLFIRDVLQEVFIVVNEDGTEAAAATAVIMQDQSGAAPATVTADRPFLFFIRDTETGTTLFMGRVTDPTD